MLVAGQRSAAWCDRDAQQPVLIKPEAAARAVRAQLRQGGQVLCCHGPATARRIGLQPFPCLDLLELFAFARPARFCLPTPRGLAAALDLRQPQGLEQEADSLRSVARCLLDGLPDPEPGRDHVRIRLGLALAMARAGWPWGHLVLRALGADGATDISGPVPPAGIGDAFAAWRRVAAFSEHAPEPPPGNVPIDPKAARQRLGALLGPGSETRPGQEDYAEAASAAFQPREHPSAPSLVLAEAGTGVGKTLGYIAPASVWTELNHGTVWVSTYTRNLQGQIDQELDRLYPEPLRKARKVVIRKGRENYLCLLNLEEATQAVLGRLNLTPPPQQDPERDAYRTPAAVALGLMARWVDRTRDGDLAGGDLPGWLPDLLGFGPTFGLADRRGECVYTACPHYNRCFIERSVRRARRAEIVVANHALVMVQAALGGLDDSNLPLRYVFDEGHHLFEAADSAFSAHLSGQETRELRRWLLGSETGRGRARGLARRVEELATDAELDLVQEALRAARALPDTGWLRRVAEAGPRGATERFLSAVRDQVRARAHGQDGPYSLETECTAPSEGMLDAALALDRALEGIARPLLSLAERFQERLAEDASDLDGPTRLRMEGLIRGLNRRGGSQVEAWRGMLQALVRAPQTGAPGEAFVDWFTIDRADGQDVDIGMHRHWVDPTEPFAAAVVAPAHGVLVTSATLTDGSGTEQTDWAVAEARSGASHLPVPAVRARAESPFDYASNTRVFIVNDVRKDNLDLVAAAYRELFLAAGGGALGLFTAISRLRGVHRRIAGAMEAAELPLLAQHVDAMDVATLVDIFREETDACLLGTDAIRDGVDVPGPSLRLIAFDRVPWARPDILHKARRERFAGSLQAGKRGYDDMIARLRLRQAFGRLVRRATDRGVFVLMDAMTPSRLLTAFPEGVPVARLGLKDALAAITDFGLTQS